MQLVLYPSKESWKQLVQRPAIDATALLEKVKFVLQTVKVNGDAAIQNFTLQFDGVQVDNPKVTTSEIKDAESVLSIDLKEAIQLAADNIKKFHSKQVATLEIIETIPGVECWRKSVGIDKVGLYIPGGSAPLFSTILMLGIPAQIAGCKEIVLCSPPNKEGKLHPAILFAAQLAGITSIYKIGGVQAIAAMAFGTETISQVYKIFGPGNQYVTAAKQLIQQEGIAIDMPAGPSEVCVLADETANASFIAADLLSQAEHGADSQVLFVTTSRMLVNKVSEEIEKQLAVLPRKGIAELALINSRLVVVNTMSEAIELVNSYAAEHLIIVCADAENIGHQITNAGSVFLGNYSPESVGDYASGTNHTLPTNGFARAYSGVSVDSFVKKITYQKLTQKGLQQIGKAVVLMAEAEGLQAHANAVSIRLQTVNK